MLNNRARTYDPACTAKELVLNHLPPWEEAIGHNLPLDFERAKAAIGKMYGDFHFASPTYFLYAREISTGIAMMNFLLHDGSVKRRFGLSLGAGQRLNFHDMYGRVGYGNFWYSEFLQKIESYCRWNWWGEVAQERIRRLVFAQLIEFFERAVSLRDPYWMAGVLAEMQEQLAAQGHPWQEPVEESVIFAPLDSTYNIYEACFFPRVLISSLLTMECMEEVEDLRITAWKGLRETAKSVFLCMTFQDFCIIVENPLRIESNYLGLHNLSGPALDWDLGQWIFAVHGVPVKGCRPLDWLKGNGPIQAIQQEKDEVIQSQLVDEFGLGLVIERLGGQVVDRTEGHELLELSLKRPLWCLRSRRRDGGFDYRRVWFHCRTVRQALSWAERGIEISN